MFGLNEGKDQNNRPKENKMVEGNKMSDMVAKDSRIDDNEQRGLHGLMSSKLNENDSQLPKEDEFAYLRSFGDKVPLSHHKEMMRIQKSMTLQAQEMNKFYEEKLKFWQESCDHWRQKYLKSVGQ